MNTAATLAAAGGLLALGSAGLALFSWTVARKVERLLPPAGRHVAVPGARLHLREFGPADTGRPAILMIHGLAGQLSHFTYGLAGQLAARHRVIVVDRPGSGHSARAPGSPADLPAQAAALAALVRGLDAGPVYVVGHSLGGAVGLALALEHPDTVAGLALLAPLTHLPDQVPPVFAGLGIRSPLLRALAAWTLAVPLSIRHGAAALDAVFGPEAAPPDFATRGGGLLGLRPSAFLAASADAQALPASLPPLQARYAGLRLPLSVLYGRDDRILDWRAQGQALVDKVPGARLVLVEGGHMLPITQVARTAGFIETAIEDAAIRPSDAAAG